MSCDRVLADPLVRAVLARFPGAEVIAVRPAEQPAALPSGEPEEPPQTKTDVKR